MDSLKDHINSVSDEIRDFIGTMLHSNLPRVVLALVFALMVGGIAIVLAEGGNGVFTSFFSAAWWALVTMTTVGYGDMVPTTTAGRLVGTGVIIVGVALTSMFTATVSSIFVAARIREGRGLQQVKYRDHIVICGWSHVTKQLLDALAGMHSRVASQVVLVADIPDTVTEDLLSRYSSIKIKYVRGEWTHEIFLKRAGVPDARTVIVLPDESLSDPVKMDEKTILATLTVKALNPKVKLLTHIMRGDNRVFLQRANADEILVSDEMAGYLLATHALAAGIPQVVNDMLEPEGSNRLILENIPRDFVGKSFADLSLHFFNQSSILLGLTREQDPLEATDVLSADSSALDEFIKRKFQEAGMDESERSRTHARLNPAHDAIIDARDFAVIIRGFNKA